MMEKGTFQSVKGDSLEKRLWLPEGDMVGMVQLVHGMCEHIGRYEATAERLNRAGYGVVGHTHLGHGEGAPLLGYFAQEGGWDALVEDTHTLGEETRERFPGLPYFLLGHSMGSFVVRTYCLKYEEGLAGVILSGTGHYAPGVVGLGRGIAKIQCALGMSQKPSKLLEGISSAGNNKGYEDVQTPFDWLSRDRAAVQKYVEDPYCGYTFTASAYGDLFDGLSRLTPQNLGTMSREIPLLLLSGDMDPVGAHGEGVRQVAEEYRQAGLKDVQVLLYPQGRHEMFNELNREQVWEDLIGWLEEKRASGKA